MIKLQTYLNFAGNAKEAFTFYKSVFGGEFSSEVAFKDMPVEGMPIPDSDADKMMHISLPIGESSILMASDTLESFGQTLVEGNNFHISIHPTSREEADKIFNSLAEGGEVEMPLGDQVWGDYYGSLKDKFGVHWMVNYSERDGATQ